MKRKRYSLLVVFAMLLMATTPIFAQGDAVVISLTVSEIMEDLFSDQIISQFEAENPGIRVHLVKTSGFGGVPYGGEDTIEEQLDAVEEYASSADVVMVETTSLSSEITRTGYFLDIYPLVNSD